MPPKKDENAEGTTIKDKEQPEVENKIVKANQKIMVKKEPCKTRNEPPENTQTRVAEAVNIQRIKKEQDHESPQYNQNGHGSRG